MKHLVVVLLFLSAPAFSHPHPNDFDQLTRQYQTLVSLFHTYLKSTDVAAPADLGSIEMDGYKIPVNSSAMNQVLTLAAMDPNLLATEGCSGCKGHGQLQIVKRWVLGMANKIVMLPFNVATSVLHPGQTLLRILATIEEIELFVIRTRFGFDPAIFAYIIVTQAAWEGLESAVMPAGMHVACTAFNMILLSTAIPMERVLRLSRVKFSGRYAVASATLFEMIRARFGRYSKLSPADALNPSSERLRVNEEHHLSPFQKTLASMGQRAPVVASISNSSDLLSRLTPSLLDDIDRVFDSNRNRERRFYVAWVLTRGLQVAVDYLISLSTAVRDSEYFAKGDVKAFAKLVGITRSLVTEFNNSLSFMSLAAVRPELESHVELKNLYSDNYQSIVELFKEIGDLVYDSNPHSEIGTQFVKLGRVSDTQDESRLTQRETFSNLVEKAKLLQAKIIQTRSLSPSSRATKIDSCQQAMSTSEPRN